MADEERARLERFATAQNPIYDRVVTELAGGRKRAHWMWFVFPQLLGLGHSEMARFYALRTMEEARLYLAHEVLGPRIRQCATLVSAIEGRSVGEIFGSPDDLKFQSS